MRHYENNKGQVLVIKRYLEADNPLYNFADTIGTYYTFEDQRKSLMEHDYDNGIEALGYILGKDYIDRVYKSCTTSEEFFKHVVKYADDRGYILYPISGTVYGKANYVLGKPKSHDSGVVGFVFIDKLSAMQRFCAKKLSVKVRKQVRELFEAELRFYTYWVNNDVYYCSLYSDPNKKPVTYFGRVGDGFWGENLDCDLDSAKQAGIFDSIGCDFKGWHRVKPDYVFYQ